MAITLLPQELRGKEKRFTKIILRFLPFVFGTYLFIILILGGAFIFTFVRRQNTVDRTNTLKQEIESLRGQESSFYVLKDRLATLEGVRAKTLAFKDIFDSALLTIGSEASLRILDITSEQEKIVLIVGGDDSFVIERFLASIANRDNPPFLENLTRTIEGEYHATLIFKI